MSGCITFDFRLANERDDILVIKSGLVEVYKSVESKILKLDVPWEKAQMQISLVGNKHVLNVKNMKEESVCQLTNGQVTRLNSFEESAILKIVDIGSDLIILVRCSVEESAEWFEWIESIPFTDKVQQPASVEKKKSNVKSYSSNQIESDEDLTGDEEKDNQIAYELYRKQRYAGATHITDEIIEERWKNKIENPDWLEEFKMDNFPSYYKRLKEEDGDWTWAKFYEMNRELLEEHSSGPLLKNEAPESVATMTSQPTFGVSLEPLPAAAAAAISSASSESLDGSSLMINFGDDVVSAAERSPNFFAPFVPFYKNGPPDLPFVGPRSMQIYQSTYYKESLRGLHRVATSCVHPANAFELVVVALHCCLLDLGYVCMFRSGLRNELRALPPQMLLPEKWNKGGTVSVMYTRNSQHFTLEVTRPDVVGHFSVTFSPQSVSSDVSTVAVDGRSFSVTLDLNNLVKWFDVPVLQCHVELAKNIRGYGDRYHNYLVARLADTKMLAGTVVSMMSVSGVSLSLVEVSKIEQPVRGLHRVASSCVHPANAFELVVVALHCCLLGFVCMFRSGLENEFRELPPRSLLPENWNDGDMVSILYKYNNQLFVLEVTKPDYTGLFAVRVAPTLSPGSTATSSTITNTTTVTTTVTTATTTTTTTVVTTTTCTTISNESKILLNLYDLVVTPDVPVFQSNVILAGNIAGYNEQYYDYLMSRLVDAEVLFSVIEQQLVAIKKDA